MFSGGKGLLPHFGSIPRFGVSFCLPLSTALPDFVPRPVGGWQRLKGEGFLPHVRTVSGGEAGAWVGRAWARIPTAPGPLSAQPLPCGSPGARVPSPGGRLLATQMGFRTPTYSLKLGLRWDMPMPWNGASPRGARWKGVNSAPPLPLAWRGTDMCVSRYCPKHPVTAGLC